MFQQTENSIIIGPNPLKAGIMKAVGMSITVLIIGIWLFGAPMLDGDIPLSSSAAAIAVGLFLITFLISYFLAQATAKKTLFTFGEDGISYNEGFMSVNKKTIAYDRITDTTFEKRFPFDHLFKTGTIQLRTAGGGYGGAMSGIRLKYIDDAEAVYDNVKQVIDYYSGKPQAATQVAASSEVSQVVSPGEPVVQAQPGATMENGVYEVRPSTKPTVVRKLVSLGIIISIILVFAVSFYFMVKPSVAEGNAGKVNKYLFLITLGIILIASIHHLIVLYFAYKNIKAKKYLFFQDKVEYEEGFFTIRKKTIQYQRITDVGFRKGWLWDKMFDVASITINTAGTMGPELVMYDIPQAEEHYEKLRVLIKGAGSSQAGVV